MSTILDRAARWFDPGAGSDTPAGADVASPESTAPKSTMAGIPSLADLKKDARRSRKRGAQLDEDLAEQRAQAEIDALWSPENCEDLCCAYFDIRLASTGFEGFDLTAEQRRKLAVPGAMALRLLKIDPRWAGLVLYLSIMSKLIIQTETGYRRALAAKAQ